MFLKIVIFTFLFTYLKASDIKLGFKTISITNNISSYSTGQKFVPKVIKTLENFIATSSDQKKNHLVISINRYNVTVKSPNASKLFNSKKGKLYNHTVDLIVEVINENKRKLFLEEIRVTSLKFFEMEGGIKNQLKFQELISDELNLNLINKLRKLFMVKIGDYVFPD